MPDRLALMQVAPKGLPYSKHWSLWCFSLQAFDADLFVADPGNLGGWALADSLNLHKAVVQVPGFTPPLVRYILHLFLPCACVFARKV